MKKGLIIGFLTGYVVKAYIANRKRERYEKTVEKQINQRDEQIVTYQREQQRLHDRLATETSSRFKQEQVAKDRAADIEKIKSKLEAVARVKAEDRIYDEQGNEIILQPGWRVERSTGGYSVVLDEHNRIVHDAIHYGEAFKRDQRREQLADNVFATMGGGAPVGGSSQAVPGPQPSVQPPASYPYGQSPLGTPPGSVDLRHRLPGPRNNFAATVFSPWAWTVVALLIIIYFIAQLA